MTESWVRRILGSRTCYLTVCLVLHVFCIYGHKKITIVSHINKHADHSYISGFSSIYVLPILIGEIHKKN